MSYLFNLHFLKFYSQKADFALHWITCRFNTVFTVKRGGSVIAWDCFALNDMSELMEL